MVIHNFPFFCIVRYRLKQDKIDQMNKLICLEKHKISFSGHVTVMYTKTTKENFLDMQLTVLLTNRAEGRYLFCCIVDGVFSVNKFHICEWTVSFTAFWRLSFTCSLYILHMSRNYVESWFSLGVKRCNAILEVTGDVCTIS